MQLSIDPDSITLGDLEDFHEVTGTDLMNVLSGMNGEQASLDLKTVRGLMWITRRKEDPAFTFEATRDMTLAELTTIEAKKSRLDPPKAGAAKSTSGSSRRSVTSGASRSRKSKP